MTPYFLFVYEDINVVCCFTLMGPHIYGSGKNKYTHKKYLYPDKRRRGKQVNIYYSYVTFKITDVP